MLELRDIPKLNKYFVNYLYLDAGKNFILK